MQVGSRARARALLFQPLSRSSPVTTSICARRRSLPNFGPKQMRPRLDCHNVAGNHGEYAISVIRPRVGPFHLTAAYNAYHGRSSSAQISAHLPEQRSSMEFCQDHVVWWSFWSGGEDMYSSPGSTHHPVPGTAMGTLSCLSHVTPVVFASASRTNLRKIIYCYVMCRHKHRMSVPRSVVEQVISHET